VQLDADGQHDAGDTPRFVEAARRAPGSLIMGKPLFDAGLRGPAGTAGWSLSSGWRSRPYPAKSPMPSMGSVATLWRRS
jgi:hypothetical protein